MIEAPRSRRSRSRQIATLLFFFLLGGLVLAGCLRPVLPELLRESWRGLVIGLALAASVAELVRRRLGEAGSEDYLLALLPLALMALYLQPQRVASDGIFYYAPLHSLVVDRDLDFENEYRILGAPPAYFQASATGRLPNHHSIGPAILWLPFFMVAHGLAQTGLYRPTGIGYPYFTFVATGTAVFGFLGVIFLFRLLRSYFPARIALAAVLLTWLATFHVWYMVFEPSMSHAPAMASVALFLLLTHRGLRGARSFAIAGAAGGAVALIRWQNVLVLPVALAVLWANRARPTLRELAAGAGALLLVVSPQLVYWKALYGSFLLIPQGGSFLDWSSPELEAVLFSSRHGLLSWTPILWLGVIGLPAFARRAPALGWSLAGFVLAALYVNASVSDWWAGASFGARRFDGVLPALGLGLAAVIAWLVRRVERRPMEAVAVALAPFILWNAMLMGVYFGGAIPPDGPASFQQAAADGLELVYRETGYPFSWPGSVPDRVAHGRPLRSYDLAGALAPAHNVDIRMGDTDALYLGRGWSLPRRGRRGTWRDASPAGAELFVALREPAPYELAIEAAAAEKVEIRVNGVAIGVVPVSGDGTGALAIAPERLRSGVNEIVFLPKLRRPMAISRVRMTRPGNFSPR